jgi:hypothetical protein
MDTSDGVPSQYRSVLSPITNVLNRKHKGSDAAPSTGTGVRSEVLTELLDRLGVGASDLLKMNIHGQEYEVLLSISSPSLRRFQRVAVQYHELPAEVRLGKEQLFEHFTRAGFCLNSDEDTGSGSGLAVFAAKREGANSTL